MSKTKEKDERVILAEALRRIAAKYPWAPVNALRQAVKDGRISSVRSPGVGGSLSRARYYVLESDIEDALLANTTTQ